MNTARDLADRVSKQRREAWEKSDPTVAMVATEAVNPDDSTIIRRVVAEAGHTGKEFDEMVRRVSALIVGRVEALADHMPADGGD